MTEDIEVYLILFLWTILALVPPTLISRSMRKHDEVYHSATGEIGHIPDSENEYHSAIGWRRLYGISLGLVGLSLVLLHSLVEDHHQQTIALWWGIGCIVIGAVLWGFYTVVGRRNYPEEESNDNG